VTCHMPSLRDAAASLGFKAVEVEGRLTIETVTGYTVASCPEGLVSVSLNDDLYIVEYSGETMETPSPRLAVALAYNAFSQHALQQHAAEIERALVHAASFHPPQECATWATRRLRLPPETACAAAIALAGLASAINKWWGGTSPLHGQEVPWPAREIPGLDEGLGLAYSVAKWPDARDRAIQVEEALLRVEPLPHARPGHLIAQTILGAPTLQQAAAAHHFTALARPGRATARVGPGGSTLLAAVEAAWLGQTPLTVDARLYHERAYSLLAYDEVILSAPARPAPGPEAVYTDRPAWKPYTLHIGGGDPRLLAASAALMDLAGLYYEGSSGPLGAGVLAGAWGAWRLNVPGDPAGPWDAVAAASRVWGGPVGVLELAALEDKG